MTKLTIVLYLLLMAHFEFDGLKYGFYHGLDNGKRGGWEVVWELVCSSLNMVG